RAQQGAGAANRAEEPARAGALLASLLLGALSPHRQLAVKALRKALRRPSVACGIISLLVLAVGRRVGVPRRAPPPGFVGHDLLTKRQSKPDSTDERIVLIGMTEKDLVDYGYPFDDEKLAEVLTKLDQLEPCVIGVDLYRDLPEPRSGALYPKLEKALQSLKR